MKLKYLIKNDKVRIYDVQYPFLDSYIHIADVNLTIFYDEYENIMNNYQREFQDKKEVLDNASKSIERLNCINKLFGLLESKDQAVLNKNSKNWFIRKISELIIRSNDIIEEMNDEEKKKIIGSGATAKSFPKLGSSPAPDQVIAGSSCLSGSIGTYKPSMNLPKWSNNNII